MRSFRTFDSRGTMAGWLCGFVALLGLAGCGAAVDVSDGSEATDPSPEPVGTQSAELVVGSGNCNVNIEPLRSIEIVHPLVVGDARASNLTDGPWSFRRLIENMAVSSNTADTDAFLRGIFESWQTDNFINGEFILRRPNVDAQILSNNNFSSVGPSGRTFNLANAPFELIAVASRLDLRSTTQGGEGRFIFALKNPPPVQGNASMTLIAEFALPLRAPLDTPLKWANKWHELDVLDPVTQTAAFNSKLQEITDFVSARGAFPGRPNGSAINQVRTNEIQLASPWQLREFRMSTSGQMLPSPTAVSPNHDAVNQSQALRDFIAQNPVLTATNNTSFFNLKTPDVFGTSFFNGGKADQSFSTGQASSFAAWSLSATETQDNNVAVDNFGLLTCNGCHTENKRTTDQAFYQVSPFNPGTDGTGRLSRFMTQGDDVKGGRRPSELLRRATDMGNLLCTPAAIDLVVSKVGMTPANPAPGQAVTFNATVTNFGQTTKAAGIINGVAFLVDGTKVTWSAGNTAAIAPGQTLTLTADAGTSGATWTATAGAHVVQAFVDDVNRVAEGDETNNKLSTTFSSGIDLTVTNIAWSPSGFPTRGQALTFSTTVKNIGTVATPAGTTIGVNFQIDGSGVSWSDSSNTSLAPGASRTLTANAGPGGIAAWTSTVGRHKLAAWVDDVNRMTDVNRSNNKIDTLLVVQ